MKKKQQTPLRRLSPREREVLKLVVDGRTSREIAILIGVKPASVDSYRSRIMAKLEVNNVASLVRLAVRNRLLRL